MSALRFTITGRSASTHARTGLVETPHGAFRTPAFAPVGTKASVKGLTPAMIRATGAEIILNNTYHLMLRPGEELIRRLGGVHTFMRWEGPILTDSGGYQVFSLAHINRIGEDGVTFKSVVDGSDVHLTPQRAVEVQNALGADIIMAFDDCPPASREEITESDYRQRVEQAIDRTARWLERCIAAHQRPEEQALFGIVQGGLDPQLRLRSLEQVCAFDLPGFAVGGVAVGESREDIARVVEFTMPRLPENRPRYLMGVGYEWDLYTAVRAGCDLFDCVLPTRNGRNANAFTAQGPLRLRNARYAEDQLPLEAECPCEACRAGYSRAYLRHLFMAGEMLGPILVSLHNITYFQRVMAALRAAIATDEWKGLHRQFPRVLGPARAET